jgi:mono/diheme cytochrome c family protein
MRENATMATIARGVALGLAAAAMAAAAGGAAAADYSARTNFVLRCSGCHGLEGAGAEKAGVPDFRGFVGAFAGDPDGRLYVARVPGVRNANLDAAATAAVLNYVMQTFGGSSLPAGASPFTAEEVAGYTARPPLDVVALRRGVAARLKAAGIETAAYPWP